MESNRLPQRRQLRREQAALHLTGSGGFRSARTPARRRGRAEAARDAGDRGNPGTRCGSGQARADLRGNFSLRQIAERVFFTFHRAPLSRFFHLSPRSAVPLFSPFTALRCPAFFTFHRAPLSRSFGVRHSIYFFAVGCRSRMLTLPANSSRSTSVVSRILAVWRQ